jgi:hypothetical protein
MHIFYRWVCAPIPHCTHARYLLDHLHQHFTVNDADDLYLYWHFSFYHLLYLHYHVLVHHLVYVDGNLHMDGSL